MAGIEKKERQFEMREHFKLHVEHEVQHSD
jgi:hypothetical protein